MKKLLAAAMLGAICLMGCTAEGIQAEIATLNADVLVGCAAVPSAESLANAISAASNNGAITLTNDYIQTLANGVCTLAKNAPPPSSSVTALLSSGDASWGQINIGGKMVDMAGHFVSK